MNAQSLLLCMWKLYSTGMEISGSLYFSFNGKESASNSNNNYVNNTNNDNENAITDKNNNEY